MKTIYEQRDELLIYINTELGVLNKYQVDITFCDPPMFRVKEDRLGCKEIAQEVVNKQILLLLEMRERLSYETGLHFTVLLISKILDYEL